MFTSSQFTAASALAAAEALAGVLAGRIHVKRVHGVEFETPGTLGEAVGLPRIIARLKSRASQHRERGRDDFVMLWDTLSERTQREVLQQLNWYEPNELDWEDPRSNRQPQLPDNPVD